MFRAILRTLRPHQWTKNFLLFAGLIFSHRLFSLVLFTRTLAAFGIFCLISGAIYIINDLIDLKKDQQHPLKRLRPIASGKISPRTAKRLAGVLLVISLLLAYRLDRSFWLVCAGYAGLMIGYSIYLKQIAILDVIIIAIGFVLRAVAGAVVIAVSISPWLLVCTLFLSLFLVLSKRRHELVLLGKEANHHRQSLSQYSPYLLDQMISVVTGSTLIAYALYTLAPRTTALVGSSYLIVTIPFVIFGIFRYLYLVYEGSQGGNPEIAIFSDQLLVVDVVLWVVVVVVILYLF
ncbi:MAG: decaprenyl-phosphate phosphoribosyltransferase [candidate division KSB1 bacterium]|nr:decaprenyl-phosphate phosphoribosyltransferase [candidate division KSB1 bacterium]MDZ7358206.1 decaprenyl-phosphate phosphoribosyltransferase [candidate division KSB1 bacterium]MDZ7399654.1 decaprenyl-phosphate phosphoribosyltransferase [candidate division KSB1 bacterium]